MDDKELRLQILHRAADDEVFNQMPGDTSNILARAEAYWDFVMGRSSSNLKLVPKDA